MIYADTATVVGLFDSQQEAEQARQDLIDHGFSEEEVSVSQQASEGGQDRGFWDSVRDFFSGEDAAYYEEASRRGAIVVTAKVRGEQRADEAADILERHNPVDVEDRASQWRDEGGGESQQRPSAEHTEGEESIPVTEERLRVGKRAERRGGVRVYSHVTEQPAEEDVQLRDEHVHVERRPVDRPADESAFEEKTIEAQETHEEPVVSKEARVVEEVELHKEADEHTETVHDTVRRTDVEVEQLDDEFRQDFDQRYANTGASFEEYGPAYRYGREAAEREGYVGREWQSVEPELRQDFERRNLGSWERHGEAVRHGFERARRSR